MKVLCGVLALCVLGSVGAKPRRVYEKTVSAQTEHSLIYFRFATALNLRATLLDGPMRQAMAAERKRLMNPSPDDHQAFVERMDRDRTAFHEIVFSADSGIDDADDFGTTDAHWKLRLMADGIEQPLVAIEKIRRPTPLHRSLYTHLNAWSDLWIARFERQTDAPREVKLHIGSGYGNDTLTWTQ